MIEQGNDFQGIILRKPDGSAMSRDEVIIRRRGSFKWLPVLCSNDLVHGSWWFFWGSVIMAISSIFPLIQSEVSDLKQEDDILPASDFALQWSMMIAMGLFFALGSLAFVRSFDEPPKPPLFKEYNNIQTDELLAAWMFLFGSLPAVPYIFVRFIFEPSVLYFIGLLLAFIFVYASWLVVKGSYPTEKQESKNYVLPFCLKLSGSAQMWAIKHMATDFLAGTWIFLWGNFLLTFICLVIMFIAMENENNEQIVIWASGSISSFFFFVGSFYYVAGSYPLATQFYYETNPRYRSGSIHETDRKDDCENPIIKDSLKCQSNSNPNQEISTISEDSKIVNNTIHHKEDIRLIPAQIKHHFSHHKSALELGIKFSNHIDHHFYSQLPETIPNSHESL